MGLNSGTVLSSRPAYVCSVTKREWCASLQVRKGEIGFPITPISSTKQRKQG